MISSMPSCTKYRHPLSHFILSWRWMKKPWDHVVACLWLNPWKWMRVLLLTFHHTMRRTSATGWISISLRFWEITLTFIKTPPTLPSLGHLWVCPHIHKRAFDCQWIPTPIEELSISVSMQSWIHLTHNRLWKCCTHLGLLIRSFGLDLWWHAEMCYFHQKF